MADAPVALTEHLVSQQAFVPREHAPGVAALVGRIGRVAAVIAQKLAHAALRDRLGYMGGTNVSGDEVKKLDVWGHETMLAGLRASGACAAFISEEAKDPIEIPEARGVHGLVVCCDPVDGSSNLDKQAGGRASTGTGRVLELEAKEYHQRAPIILGSPDDVALAEEFYRTSS